VEEAAEVNPGSAACGEGFMDGTIHKPAVGKVQCKGESVKNPGLTLFTEPFAGTSRAKRRGDEARDTW
jgi:hypothetical protein